MPQNYSSTSTQQLEHRPIDPSTGPTSSSAPSSRPFQHRHPEPIDHPAHTVLPTPTVQSNPHHINHHLPPPVPPRPQPSLLKMSLPHHSNPSLPPLHLQKLASHPTAAPRLPSPVRSPNYPPKPLPQLHLSPSTSNQHSPRTNSVSKSPNYAYFPSSNTVLRPNNSSPPHATRPRFSSQATSYNPIHTLSSTPSPPPPPPPRPPKPNLSQKYPHPSTPFNTRSPTIASRTAHPAGPRDWPSHYINSPTRRSPSSDHKGPNDLSSLIPDTYPNYPRKQSVPDFTSLSIKKRISLTSNLGLGLPTSVHKPRPSRVDDSDEEEEEEEEEEVDMQPGSNLVASRPNLPFQPFKPPPPPPSSQNDKRHLSRALSGSWLQSPINTEHISFDPNQRKKLYESIGNVEDIPDPTFANRRPPCSNPPVTISIGSQFSSWTLRGNWLCTGHHQLKLWHAGTGECLSQVTSMQDIKITFMEFKTSTFQGNDQKTSANNSRYVWCGTKEGQLFEFDCLERRIIDSKSSLHSAPVVGLFRCKQGGMCSMDESGKVQIWSNNLGSSSSTIKISGVSRAQRIADKTNFTKMISHRLWTASGPSGSKTASTPAQRGPSIRVYDPDLTQAWTVTPRPITIPEAVIGGVMVGMVTAGAVVPARPELVFLGHESGHVSVWETRFQDRALNQPKPATSSSQLDPESKNRDHISSSSSSSSSSSTTTTTTTQDPSLPGRPRNDHLEPPPSTSSTRLNNNNNNSNNSNNNNLSKGIITFKKLIKLSNFQITSMEGVTKYLWVGFRTGFVHVYEPEIETPNIQTLPLVGSSISPQNNNAIPKSNLNHHTSSHPSSAGSWKVLKIWRAHKDSVLKIVVDPSLLWDEVGKLHVATTSTDWKIKLWDGTMSVDWLATEMRKRQTEYCTYRPIKALICSWNVDACKPSELTGTTDNLNFLEDVLKSSFTTNDLDHPRPVQYPSPSTPIPSHNAKFPTSFSHHSHNQNFTSSTSPSSSNAPDLIVFGFQEMIDLENKKLTAKTVLLGGRKKAAGTNGGNSAEKLSDSVSQVYRKWHDKLVLTVKTFMPPDDPYVVIHTENLVGLFTCVFVKSSERAKMRDIAVTTVKTGMKGRYGNKGAILARLVIDDSSICFINCHLAAGQKHVRQRNSDLIDILEEKSGFPDPPENKNGNTNHHHPAMSGNGTNNNHTDCTNGVYVGGGNGSSISDHEICFLQGDLNYRIDSRREHVIRAIAAGEYCKLLEFDQLIKEKKTNPLFRLRSFYEPPIRFHPTYKYDPGTHMYDSSEKARVPAWCDRILYRTPIEETTCGSPPTIYIQQESMSTRPMNVNKGERSNYQLGAIGRIHAKPVTIEKIVENINYRRYEINISDHRPISGTYRIFIKSIVPGLKRLVLDHALSKWKDHEAQIINESRRYYSRL